jgi:hypothetical protein
MPVAGLQGQPSSTNFPRERAIDTAAIDFSLDEPCGLGLEIRVVGSSDNAQGQLAFGHVALRPLAMRQPDAITGSQDDVRIVLDLQHLIMPFQRYLPGRLDIHQRYPTGLPRPGRHLDARFSKVDRKGAEVGEFSTCSILL